MMEYLHHQFRLYPVCAPQVGVVDVDTDLGRLGADPAVVCAVHFAGAAAGDGRAGPVRARGRGRRGDEPRLQMATTPAAGMAGDRACDRRGGRLRSPWGGRFRVRHAAGRNGARASSRAPGRRPIAQGLEISCLLGCLVSVEQGLQPGRNIHRSESMDYRMPYVAVGPADEMDVMPAMVAITGRQGSPAGAGIGHPKHGFDEVPRACPVSCP